VQILSLKPVSPDVQPFLDAALARVKQCEEVAAQYLTNLNVTMDHHKHSIELAKTYNSKATQFAFAADDLEEEIEQPLLYQSVAEVQASIEALETQLRSVSFVAVCVVIPSPLGMVPLRHRA
jgi:methyl-accepting chemotaxis protein